MRVFGTQAASTPSVRKTQRSNRTSATFTVETPDAPDEPQATRSPSGVTASSPVDALLALQAVEGEEQADSRGKKRGRKLLDLLEEVRHGLLLGVIPASKLNGLVAAVRTEQTAVSDPILKSILDEIDLRASVELEKLGLDSGL